MNHNVELRRISTEECVPKKSQDYVDVGLGSLLDQLKFGPNLIFKGPKGAGKTIAVEQWAAEHGMPLVRQECCEETSARDLVGTFSAQGGDVFYQMGSLTAAIDIANEEGACVLVLEEINTLPPTVQKVINPLTDYRKAISVPKIGRVFRLEPKKKLWVLGTMNPNYAGTYGLNEDFRSRFEFVEVGYMPIDKERALLEAQFDTPPGALERSKVGFLLNLAKETRGERMGYGLSTRDLVEFIRNWNRMNSLDKALKMLEGKFEGENVDNFRTRCMDAFKVKLGDVALYTAPRSP